MKRILILITCLFSLSAFAEGRYYYEGNGCLKLRWDKSKRKFNGCYRNQDGSYNAIQLKQLNHFFNVPADLGENFSLRTIAFLDYLEDKFSKGKTLIINSGYRSPEYNAKLRKGGALAGKTSYHLDAMAVDVTFPGVKSETVWEYAKSLKYGGAGYYRSKAIHIDSGKPRNWTPENAIDPDDKPPLNQNIYMSVDKDVYLPGETIQMFFSGVSDYPFGLKSMMTIYKDNESVLDISPNIKGNFVKDCIFMEKKEQIRKISWKIPNDFSTKNQKVKIHVRFCDPIFANQPKEIDSREFEILEPAVAEIKKK